MTGTSHRPEGLPTSRDLRKHNDYCSRRALHLTS